MLRVHHLTKSFRKKKAVDDLSFDAKPGEITGVVGPNGAGKSTTFLCLAGLLRPDEGAIEWDGTTLGAQRGRTITLVPETPDVYPNLTVWEHFAFATASCNIRSGWQDTARELLERLHLADKRDTLGGALSKGMKQKTLIIAGMLVDAPVLLFDEPTIGLDPAGQRELRELLLDLRSRGKLLLVSTHNLEGIATLADTALVMKEGRAVWNGPFDAMNETGEDVESAFLRVTS